MEENIFPRPEVSGELSKVVEARLHTDRPSPKLDQILELQKRYAGSVALPVYVVLDPVTGAELGAHKGLTSPSNFAQFLREATAEDRAGG